MAHLKIYFIHKHEVAQQYGGSEEGGWWYDSGIPVECAWHLLPIPSESLAYKLCRWLNEKERARQEAEETYDYTSVLSYRSTHYAYSVQEHAKQIAYPQERPYYE